MPETELTPGRSTHQRVGLVVGPLLAAIVMLAVVRLIEVKPFIHAWKTQRWDGVVAVVTFVTTLALAPAGSFPKAALGCIFAILSRRMPLARKPAWRMRWKPEGSTWVRKRRMNSPVGSLITFIRSPRLIR